MHKRQSVQRKGLGDGGSVAIPSPSLALLFPLAERMTLHSLLENKNREGGMTPCLPARAQEVRQGECDCHAWRLWPLPDPEDTDGS